MVRGEDARPPASTWRRLRRAAAWPTSTPVEGHLTVYMTTQAPHAIRTVLALVAGHVGLSEEKIRVGVARHRGEGSGGRSPSTPAT